MISLSLIDLAALLTEYHRQWPQVTLVPSAAHGGSAELAHDVADGRLDGFAEDHLNAWDVVAGMVLVTEAGGWCSDFLAGDGLKSGNRFAAASPSIRHDLTRLLRPFERL